MHARHARAYVLNRLARGIEAPLGARALCPEQLAELAFIVERELKDHKLTAISALRRILLPHVQVEAYTP